MDLSRAFVAIELDTASAGIIAKWIHALKSKVSDVRWSRPDQLHLTLKFLGDVDNRELPELCAAMHEACQGIEAFSLDLSGLGAFPKNKPPRVVWVSADDPQGGLGQLAERLDERFAELGIAKDNRAFTPHLTLGRVTRDTDLQRLQEAIDQVADQISCRCEVEEIVMLSSLKDDGRVVYDAIDRVELQF